jgi:hypothetical protein
MKFSSSCFIWRSPRDSNLQCRYAHRGDRQNTVADRLLPNCSLNVLDDNMYTQCVLTDGHLLYQYQIGEIDLKTSFWPMSTVKLSKKSGLNCLMVSHESL